MTKFVLWGLLVIALLLVLTHPAGFSSAVSSVGGFTIDESAILAGGNAAGAVTPKGGASGPLYGFNTVRY